MPRRAATLDLPALLADFGTGAGQPDDEATEAMLDATSVLLSRYGVKRWSMDDVAAAAGLGRATVYRRFDGRNSLVRASLARDAHRFFIAIAAAVVDVEGIENKVVEGILVGLRVVRNSPLPALLATDTAEVMALLRTAPVMALCRAALTERYEALSGERLKGRRRAEAELLAEVLVRLGLSFFLMPESVIDLDDPRAARMALRRIVRPLLRESSSDRRQS